MPRRVVKVGDVPFLGSGCLGASQCLLEPLVLRGSGGITIPSLEIIAADTIAIQGIKMDGASNKLVETPSKGAVRWQVGIWRKRKRRFVLFQAAGEEAPARKGHIMI